MQRFVTVQAKALREERGLIQVKRTVLGNNVNKKAGEIICLANSSPQLSLLQLYRVLFVYLISQVNWFQRIHIRI